MNTNKSLLECEVCICPYNESERTPRLFPQCGHTVCSQCLAALLAKSDNDKILCCFCRSPSSVRKENKMDLSVFPRNLTIVNLMSVKEPATPQPMCLAHGQAAGFVCLDNSCRSKGLLCHKCLSSNHKQCSPDFIVGTANLKDRILCQDSNRELLKAIDALEEAVNFHIAALKDMIHGQINCLKSRVKESKATIDFANLDSLKSNLSHLECQLDPQTKVIKAFNLMAKESLASIGDLKAKLEYKINHRFLPKILGEFKQCTEQLWYVEERFSQSGGIKPPSSQAIFEHHDHHKMGWRPHRGHKDGKRGHCKPFFKHFGGRFPE